MASKVELKGSLCRIVGEDPDDGDRILGIRLEAGEGVVLFSAPKGRRKRGEKDIEKKVSFDELWELLGGGAAPEGLEERVQSGVLSVLSQLAVTSVDAAESVEYKRSYGRLKWLLHNMLREEFGMPFGGLKGG